MLCEGVILYMMLVTVFKNKFNKQSFFLILGWGKLPNNSSTVTKCIYKHLSFSIVPAIPIVAISVGIAHEHYGTDH